MRNFLYEVENQVFAVLVFVLGINSLQAQTFPTPTGFTLPAGKTIVITYEVDVNANACPTGTIPGGPISNQSNVSGSNFSTVQTDDPDVAGPSNPTVTPFSALTLGNLVYDDINRNGIFDGSDAGINGVLLNLYVDNGDGVLTAADGAPIATATTAGGGLYSFSVCPGNYIVEVAASNFTMGGALYNAGAPYVSSPVGGAPDPDNNVDNDDNGDPVSGFGVASQAITLAYGAEPTGSGNENLTLDFGFKTPTTVSINSVTLAEGTGGSTTAFNFTVTRSDNTEAFSLSVNTMDGTATVGDNDYSQISGGTVSFTAGGSLTATITVSVNHDNKVEANETFTVVLSGAPSGIIITNATGMGAITNDDSATLTLSGGTAQDEGNMGATPFTFTATLSAPVQGGFQVAYTTSNGVTNPATAGSDYTDNDGTLTFTGTAGEAKTWTVNVNGDNTVELDETFEGSLGAISMTTMTQAAAITVNGSPQISTITNDDAATVSIAADVSQSEAVTPQAFSVTLSNPVDVPVSVLFNTADGTATTGDNDYTGIVNQMVSFPANTTTAQTVNVAIGSDNKVESNETYAVSIGSLSVSGRNVILGTSSRTGTILNDDNATVTLTPAGGVSQNEGNSGTTNFVFTATLNNPVQDGFTIAYAANDGTATTADNDYVDNDGALAFAGTAGEMQTITVLVNGDLNIEPDEAFTVSLGTVVAATPVQTDAISAAGSPKTGTILNDEKDWGDAPTAAQSGFANTYPTLAANNGANHNLAPGGLRLGASVDADLDGQPNATATGDGADENGVTLPTSFITGLSSSITVNVSAACKLDAWIDWNRDGDWNDPGEQIFTSQSLVAGDNALTVAVPVVPIGTSFARFRVSTAGGLPPTGNALDGEVEDYAIEILNRAISINDVNIAEGDAGTTSLIFTVSLNTPAGPGGVTFDIATADNTATDADNDYEPKVLTNQLIPEGQSDYMFSVTINGDEVVENNETFFVNITSVTGAGVADGQGMGIITNDDMATLTLSGGTAQNEGDAGTTAYTFTATLSKAVQGGFQVAYATGGGTATVGTDYTDNDGTLTFAGTAGETKTWTVNVNGDNTVELDETFEGSLGAISMTTPVQIAAISVAASPQTSTITNDDAATISIAADVSQLEAITPQTFSVTLSNPVDVPVSVLFNTANGTATTADNDYTGIVNQMVTFAANTTTAQTVNVTIANDNKVEADEVYNVSIGALNASGRNVSLGTSSRTGTILNDDSAIVTLTPATILMQNEGNTGTTPFVFTATLNNPVQGGFTLPYTTSDGTATTADNDYVDNDGILTFAGTMGEAKTITVLVNGDLKVEANETFVVALGAIAGAPAGVTVAGSPQGGVIVNDEIDFGDAPDSYGTLLASNGARHVTSLIVRLGAMVDGDLDGQPGALADGDDTDAEGNDDDGVTLPSALVLNTTANITVNASINGFVNAWVDFNLNGNFNDPGDLILNQVAVVAGNNSLSFAVPSGAVPGNSYARFRFTQTAVPAVPTGLQTTGEVEDYAIEIVNTQFSIDAPTVVEGNAGISNLMFTVSRTVNANDCSVDYAITGGTATSGADYVPLAAGTLTFTAGGPLTQSITVQVNGDNTVELNETVEITLSNPVSASILDGNGTGTIINDDAAVITVSSPSIVEGDAGTSTLTFTLNMSNPSDANVSVNYTTVDGTATTANNDYLLAAGSHTFTPGQQVKTVAVTINGDCTIEPDESFLLRLSGLANNGRNVSLSGGGSTLDGMGTITNDDALPVVTCPMNTNYNTAPGLCNATLILPLPALSSICGSAVLEFRYRPVNAMNTPTGAYNAYAPSTSNTVVLVPGRYEIEWRVTDGSGSSTCSYFIGIIDNEPPMVACSNQTVTFNGQNTIPLNADSLVAASDNCGVATIVLSPLGISCEQVGQTVPVTVTVTDINGNPATCTSNITVAGLPCGWSQNPNGVGCANGNSIAYNPANGVWTATSTNCFYGPGFTSDATAFAQRTLCGDGSITAEVTSISGTALGWAGVVMRESNAAGAKKAQLVTNLSGLSRREFRTTTNGAANPQQFPSQDRYWLRIVRAGSQFSMYVSPNGLAWYFVGAQNIPMNACIQVGLVATNYQQTSTVTATFANVGFTGSNVPPLVGVSAPLNTLNELTPDNSQQISAFQAYPNPTNGELNVNLAQYLGRAVRVEVYSLTGQLLRFVEIEEVQTAVEQLDLSALQSGMYLVTVKSEGLPEATRRIVLTE